MKTKTTLIMLMFISLSVKTLLSQVTFQQVDSIYSIDFCVHQTSDQGYITSGSVVGQDSATSSKVYGCLLKLNSNGQVVWSKKYRADSLDFNGMFSEQTTDGGYILGGELRDTSSS